MEGPCTFIICSNLEQYQSVCDAARKLGVMVAAAGLAVVACRGSAEQLRAKGMSNDLVYHEGVVPRGALKAIKDKRTRAGIERVVQLYGVRTQAAVEVPIVGWRRKPKGVSEAAE